MAVVAADIHTTVKRAFSVKRIDALAKASRDLTFHRPEIRSAVGAIPIGRSGVAGHPQADAYARIARKGEVRRAPSWSSDEVTSAS